LPCRWAEVGLLLRKPIENEGDMHYTIAAAEAGLIYTDQVIGMGIIIILK